MKGIEAEKAAIRSLVLRQIGVNPGISRTFAGQANTLGMDAAFLRLPSSTAPQVDLQDLTTGDRWYMVDASAIDGDHLIM